MHGAPQQLVNVLRTVEETPAVTQVEVTRLGTAASQQQRAFDIPTVARLLPIPQRTVAVQAEPQTVLQHTAAGQTITLFRKSKSMYTTACQLT